MAPEDREKLVIALANIFPTAASSSRLLDAIGLPRHRRPSEVGLQPVHRWHYIVTELEDGAVEDPYRALVTKALGDYPHNRILRDLSERYHLVMSAETIVPIEQRSAVFRVSAPDIEGVAPNSYTTEVERESRQGRARKGSSGLLWKGRLQLPKDFGGESRTGASLDRSPPTLVQGGDIRTYYQSIIVASGRAADLGPVEVEPDRLSCRKLLEGALGGTGPSIFHVYPLHRYLCMLTLRGRLALLKPVQEDGQALTLEVSVWR